MGNPLMKWLCMLSCIISSVAAINLGLVPFGYDFFRSNFVLMNMTGFIAPMYYIVLLAGIISLACFIMCVTGNCCNSCNGKSCCK